MSRAIPHCCIMWLPHVTIIMHVNILWGSNEDHVDVYIDHFAFSGSLCCSAITAMAFSPNHNQLGIALVYCSMFCRECSILNVAQNMAPFHNHYCTHPQFHTSHIHVHRENLWFTRVPHSTSHKIHHHLCCISCSVHWQSSSSPFYSWSSWYPTFCQLDWTRQDKHSH